MKICLNCKKELKRQQKFCDNKCQQKFYHTEYIRKWKSGEITGNLKMGCSRQIRTYLLKKTNYSCKDCGWNKRNEFTNRVPLELHHIDGDWMNNKEENLKILCPNCHTLTKNHRSRGKGRHFR